MKVTIEKTISMERAIEALKQAKLEETGDQDIFFYQEAEVRLAEFFPEELNPVALYALRKNLDQQRVLRDELLKFGVDTLHLNKVLHLRTEQGLIGMIPPYVEISEEPLSLAGRAGDRLPPERQILRLPLLIDGLHRALLAKEIGSSMTCLVVRNLPRTHPYPAYPCGWEEIIVGESVPPVKKYYRLQDKYTFMRPLDTLRLLPKTGTEYGRS